MTPRLLTAAGLLLAAAAPLAAGDADPALAKLQGPWAVEGMVENGQPLDANQAREEFAQDGRVIIDGQTIRYTKPLTGQKRELPFQFVKGDGPAAIDITAPDKQVHRGIYKLEGDTLTLCVSGADQNARPTAFTAPDGSHHLLITLKKVRP